MTEDSRNTLPEIAVVAHEGEPRARDVDIADRLGLARPRNIRKLIETNRTELEAFGPLPLLREAKVGLGRPERSYLLNEEQALLVATVSSAPNAPAVRSMLIRTFVAWRRGHLETHTGLNEEAKKAIGGIVKGVLHREITVLLPDLVRAAVASQSIMLRRGKTAGQLWREHGLPPIKNVTLWFGNKLDAVGCRIDGEGKGELGSTTARLFDPDKVGAWLRNGGRLLCNEKIDSRKGRPVQLRIVGT